MNSPLLRLVALGSIVALIQATMISAVRVFGVHPDLLLLFTMVVAVSAGPRWGAATGFAAGIVSDSMMVSGFGLWAFVYCVAGFIIGSLSSETSDAMWVIGLLSALGSALAVAGFLVARAILGDGSTPVDLALRATFVIAGVNLLLAPLCYRASSSLWAGPGPVTWRPKASYTMLRPDRIRRSR